MLERHTCVYQVRREVLQPLQTKIQVQSSLQVSLRIPFIGGDVVIAHSAKDPQQLMTQFSQACQESSLTISLKKTQVMA